MQPFEQIYTDYGKLVYNLALQYTQNTWDAEDITQEVFIKINHNLHTHDASKASLKTWIYQISTNQCLDFIKSKKTKKRFGNVVSLFGKEDQQLGSRQTEFNHPGVLTEDKEALQTLFAALNKIAPNQKTALILSRIEGHSQREVAEIMGISVKAVESLLQRGKQNLVNILGRQKGNEQLIVLIVTKLLWI